MGDRESGKIPVFSLFFREICGNFLRACSCRIAPKSVIMSGVPQIPCFSSAAQSFPPSPLAAMPTVQLKICIGTTCYMLGASKLMNIETEFPPEWKDREKGTYDCGYDSIRSARLERQKQMGLIPAQTPDTDLSNPSIQWNKLSWDVSWKLSVPVQTLQM